MKVILFSFTALSQIENTSFLTPTDFPNFQGVGQLYSKCAKYYSVLPLLACCWIDNSEIQETENVYGKKLKEQVFWLL